MRFLTFAATAVLSLPIQAWAALPAYTPEQSNRYMSACVEKAKSQAPPFVSEQFFQRYCQCTLNHIQERVSYDDFRDMAKAKEQNQTLTPAQRRADAVLDESLKVCFARMGI